MHRAAVPAYSVLLWHVLKKKKRQILPSREVEMERSITDLLELNPHPSQFCMMAAGMKIYPHRPSGSYEDTSHMKKFFQ